MKIGKQFNQLTYREYLDIIDRREKYTDFNILGLYRSLLENEKLSLAEKIAIRDRANRDFGKTFEFLQLKDPLTYIRVSTLGINLTVAEERQLWEEIRINQEKILKAKRIKHRNFGIYAKHDCGYENCYYNGLMVRQGSRIAESNMHFTSDIGRWSQKLKVDRRNVAKRKLRDSAEPTLYERGWE